MANIGIGIGIRINLKLGIGIWNRYWYEFWVSVSDIIISMNLGYRSWYQYGSSVGYWYQYWYQGNGGTLISCYVELSPTISWDQIWTKQTHIRNHMGP